MKIVAFFALSILAFSAACGQEPMTEMETNGCSWPENEESCGLVPADVLSRHFCTLSLFCGQVSRTTVESECADALYLDRDSRCASESYRLLDCMTAYGTCDRAGYGFKETMTGGLCEAAQNAETECLRGQ